MNEEYHSRTSKRDNPPDGTPANYPADYSSDNEHIENARDGSEDNPTDGSAKPTTKLSNAERARRQMARRAKRFPNGPEAKALATAEPAAPKSLIDKIENSAERAQWEEAFDWLVTSMRAKARNGGKWHGKRLFEEIQKTYSAVVLNAAEAKWLVSWIGHLCTYRQKLRSGDKYSPGVNILEALGVANANDVLLDEIEALDHPKSAPAEMAPAAAGDRNANSPEAKMVGSETEESERHSRAAVVPISSIEELPATPRDIPFSFTKLEHTKGKDFWRAYWKSNTLEEIIANGRAFVLDLEAIKEVRNLGAEVSALLDETMLKLGITLP